MKRKEGITLIALVVTIIVLIILAGVSISLVLGNNGIVTKAKQGKATYQEASVLEKVEMALVEYNMEKLENTEEGEVTEALNYLSDKEIFEYIDEDYDMGIIGDYEITLSKEATDVVVGKIEKANEERSIRYAFTPRGYSNGPIEISIKTTGDIKKIIKPDNTEVQAENGKIEITYPANENKTYLFKVEDEEGKQEEVPIEVNKIDTLPPKAFQIKAQNQTTTGFTIQAEAEDEEARDGSVCSGIDRYEYYVSSDETNYTRYTNNQIGNLTAGIYKVYVLAYDKAGNSTKSNEEYVLVGGTYIYNRGDECVELTGGWHISGMIANRRYI